MIYDLNKRFNNNDIFHLLTKKKLKYNCDTAVLFEHNEEKKLL